MGRRANYLIRSSFQFSLVPVSFLRSSFLLYFPHQLPVPSSLHYFLILDPFLSFPLPLPRSHQLISFLFLPLSRQGLQSQHSVYVYILFLIQSKYHGIWLKYISFRFLIPINNNINYTEQLQSHDDDVVQYQYSNTIRNQKLNGAIKIVFTLLRISYNSSANLQPLESELIPNDTNGPPTISPQYPKTSCFSPLFAPFFIIPSV